MKRQITKNFTFEIYIHGDCKRHTYTKQANPWQGFLILSVVCFFSGVEKLAPETSLTCVAI